MTGLNNGSSYTLEWQVSQNGSSDIIDVAIQVGYQITIQLGSIIEIGISRPPYSYLSTLYEDDLVVAFSNGSGDSIATLSDGINPGFLL